MGAGCPYREEFIPFPGKEYRLVADLPHQHRAIGKITLGNPLRQIRLIRSLCFRHLSLPHQPARRTAFGLPGSGG
jgi:hypothetical protein